MSDINYNCGHLIRSKSSGKSINGVPMMLSCGVADNTIKVWDMKRFKMISEIQISNNSANSGGSLPKAVWTRNGSIISANGGIVRLLYISDTKNASSQIGDNSVPENTVDATKRNSMDPNSFHTAIEENGGCGSLKTASAPEWRSKVLLSQSHNCTDLISTDVLVATSTKSGQIYCWK